MRSSASLRAAAAWAGEPLAFPLFRPAAGAPAEGALESAAARGRSCGLAGRGGYSHRVFGMGRGFDLLLFGLHHGFPFDGDADHFLLGRNAHAVEGLGWVFVGHGAEKMQAEARPLQHNLALLQANLVDGDAAERVRAFGRAANEHSMLVEVQRVVKIPFAQEERFAGKQLLELLLGEGACLGRGGWLLLAGRRKRGALLRGALRRSRCILRHCRPANRQQQNSKSEPREFRRHANQANGKSSSGEGHSWPLIDTLAGFPEALR